MTTSRKLISRVCLSAILLASSGSVALGNSFQEFFDGATPPILPVFWTGDPFSPTTPSFRVVTTDPETPPNCVSVQCPGGVRDVSLYSPRISIISDLSTLNFKHKHAFDLNDNGAEAGGRLEISIDGVRQGSWQDIVDAGGVFLSGQYDALISDQTNPLFGGARQLWTGFLNDAYRTVSVRLPAIAAGKTIQLRWRMVTGSDAATTIGWKIDSVLLCDPGDTSNTLCPNPPSTNCGTPQCAPAVMATQAMMFVGMIGQRWLIRRRRSRRIARRSFTQ
jgi:hypothetical protein